MRRRDHASGDWGETIRVSVGSLCRIESDRRFLLGLNKDRSKQGFVVFTPIGGAIEVESPEDLEMLEAMGALWEGHGGRSRRRPVDLRFRLPAQALPDLDQWLDNSHNAEKNALRELREELVEEYGLVNEGSVEESTLRELKAEYLWRTIQEERTERSGAKGENTRRYSFVCKIQLPPGLQGRLNEASADSRGLLAWADEADILAGRFEDGRRIGSNARSLLHSRH